MTAVWNHPLFKQEIKRAEGNFERALEAGCSTRQYITLVLTEARLLYNRASQHNLRIAEKKLEAKLEKLDQDLQIKAFADHIPDHI